jgi:PAS domain S-box-containing protein
MSMTALFAWHQIRMNRIPASVHVLAYGYWAAVTAIAFFTGGVNGMAIIVYPQIILFLGWMAGTRSAVAMTLLATSSTLGFVLAESWGFLPAPPPTPPALRWMVQSLTFVSSAILVVNFVRSYQSRLNELSDLDGDLNHAQAVAHVGSWVYELVTDVMRLSAETCRIFGLPKGTAGSHESYLARVHPDDKDRVDSAWQAALKGGPNFKNEHRILVRGNVRWIKQIAELEHDANGRPLRSVGTTQDITERKQIEARRHQVDTQLRESQKMEALGTLAGGVAHDFNNALATIMGNVELARQDVGSGHAALVSLEEIAKAGRRAKDLVQQILAFGRRQKLERKPTSLALVVLESARLVRATLPAMVHLSVECEHDTPAVLADAMQINQILLNLCGNALQAVQDQERPGVIEVRLRAYEHTQGEACSVLRPGRHACLSVRDNGPGMDATTSAHIFEPFFTTKPNGKGTGLGLSVVHSIVQSHEARIEVESLPGSGSTFRIYFPAAEAPLAELVAPVAVSTPVHTKGMHVLYVDDEEAIIFLMTRLLERKGYRVSGYTDPREALAAVRADPGQFDLAVTDYNMPGMSGLAVASALSEIRSDLPVVLASGYITEDLRAKAPAAGVRELIYKPNTVDDLCEAVARYANAQIKVAS